MHTLCHFPDLELHKQKQTLLKKKKRIVGQCHDFNLEIPLLNKLQTKVWPHIVSASYKKTAAQFLCHSSLYLLLRDRKGKCNLHQQIETGSLENKKQVS